MLPRAQHAAYTRTYTCSSAVRALRAYAPRGGRSLVGGVLTFDLTLQLAGTFIATCTVDGSKCVKAIQMELLVLSPWSIAVVIFLLVLLGVLLGVCYDKREQNKPWRQDDVSHFLCASVCDV